MVPGDSDQRRWTLPQNGSRTSELGVLLAGATAPGAAMRWEMTHGPARKTGAIKGPLGAKEKRAKSSKSPLSQTRTPMKPNLEQEIKTEKPKKCVKVGLFDQKG